MTTKKKIISGGLIAICVTIAIFVFFSQHEINYAEPVDMSKLEDVKIVNEMVLMTYASKEKAIFYYSFGLFVYDMQKQTIYRSLDLKTIDCNYINGSTYTEVIATPDGKTIYIFNRGDKTENFMYKYDVEADKLTKVNRVEIKDKYAVMLTADVSPDEYKNQEGKFSPVVAPIDRGVFAYMFSENLIAKDLQLMIYDENSQSKEVFNVFQ